MPSNNTNTRLITYIGDDPELRKFIHKWDSVNYEFSEDENEKILKPRCGYGYAIHRNVKDIYIKLPPHPYDGDMFAIMDITHVNDDYIQETYRNNGTLPKEEVITTDLTLTTAKIYVDNSYDFVCRTKVIYDDRTYQPGEIFQLENTCCYLYVFGFSKDINAWVVKWVEKECTSNECKCQMPVKVIIRFSDGDPTNGGVLLKEDVFTVQKGSTFSKSYKNSEIYDIFKMRSNHEGTSTGGDYYNGGRPDYYFDSDSLLQYFPSIVAMRDFYLNTLGSSILTFPELWENLYTKGSYYFGKIICTNNTIDGEKYDDFPFETGYYGEFFNFSLSIKYRQGYRTQELNTMNHAPIKYYQKNAEDLNSATQRNHTIISIYNSETNAIISDETLNNIVDFINQKKSITYFYLDYSSSSYISYKYFNGNDFISESFYPIKDDNPWSWSGSNLKRDYYFNDFFDEAEITQPITFKMEYDLYSAHYEDWIYSRNTHEPIEKLNIDTFFVNSFRYDYNPQQVDVYNDIFGGSSIYSASYSSNEYRKNVNYKGEEYTMLTGTAFILPLLIRPVYYYGIEYNAENAGYYQYVTPREYKVNIIQTAYSNYGRQNVHIAYLVNRIVSEFVTLATRRIENRITVDTVEDSRYIKKNHYVYTFDSRKSKTEEHRVNLPANHQEYTINHFADVPQNFFNQETKFEFVVTGDETIINVFTHEEDYGYGYSTHWYE